MKVLLAVDGSADTKRMLAYLATHDDLLGASPKYVVLNVQPAVPGGAAKFAGKEMVAEFHQAEAESVLGPVTKFLDRHNASYTADFRVGHAAEEILRAAKKSKVDMIIMGSQGRGSIRTLLLGSVAQKVLSGSEVPVMVVR
ncbi:MAG TPA: universal stress protein [Casimicrobium sp.]|nr:universal stress protein [Burkholderiales bacterium]HNY45460.1 universal stress protein [Casimicrobium sp.]HPG62747.1 universal stress protein [Casimicrobium sp.]HPT57070.1 universal stress protein [Casimicrobium sp.]HPV23780.1 universal stress protein [Casimicrobium sp.]